MNKFLNSTRNRVKHFISLINHARGFKYKTIIGNYLLRNLLGRVFFSLKPKKEIFIKMDELKFYFAPGQSELSPYPEICHEKIYEKDARFIPKEGNTVMDIGGHIGIFTIISAKRCGETGKLYTYEPNPETFKRLKKNIEANKLTQVQLNNLAVSEKDGLLNMKIGDSSQGSTIMEKGTLSDYSKTVSVQTCTLDNIVSVNDILKIDILKIDAEGAELLILKGGMKQALPITKKIMIETHSTKLKRECKKILGSEGFNYVLDIPSGTNHLGQCSLVYFTR